VALHERVFCATRVTRTSDVGRGVGGSVLLRVRCHDARPGHAALVYFFPLQRRKTERTASRRRIIVPMVGDAATFVQDLGFNFDHEFRREGIRYTFKDTLAISVTQIFKIGNSNGEDAEPAESARGEPHVPIDPMHLVEVTAVTTPSHNMLAIGKEMTSFAEQLQPLVQLHFLLDDKFQL